jgi:hypothetical protein
MIQGQSHSGGQRRAYSFGKGLGPTGLDKRHDIDSKVFSNFIIGGITRIVQRLDDDELGELIDAPNEIYRWIWGLWLWSLRR